MNKKIIVCIGVPILVVTMVLLLWRIRLTVPTPPPYKQGVGLRYAKMLAEQTQKLSLLLIVSGWILVTSGGLLATAGAVLGSRPLKEDNPTITAELTSQRGLMCTVLAVALAGIGWQCIDRSTSATKTASIANAAIATATVKDNGEQDKKAYEACVKAKSAWLEGRMNHERLQSIIDDMTNSNDATGDQSKTKSAGTN